MNVKKSILCAGHAKPDDRSYLACKPLRFYLFKNTKASQSLLLNISVMVDPWLRLEARRGLEHFGGIWGTFKFLIWAVVSQAHLSTLWKLTGYIFLPFCLFCSCRRFKRQNIWTQCGWCMTLGLNISFRGQNLAAVSILFMATVFWSLNKAVFGERCWLDFTVS